MLRGLAWFFFFTYVGLVILAGGWGVFFGRIDMDLLLHVDLQRLPPETSATLLSQYRFLRALELGFGLFAIRFRREIFTPGVYNVLFLGTMAAGVLARVVGFVLDGRPTGLMIFFAAYELVAFVVIVTVTRGWPAARPARPVP